MNLRPSSKELVVTGSSGFIGQTLVPFLEDKYVVNRLSLRDYQKRNINLENVQAVIYLTGVAHKMEEIDSDIYFDVNRDLTLEFAEHVKNSGVPLFVYLSSTKVYKEDKTIFNEHSHSSPDEPYGQSKLAAEIGLQKMQSDAFKIAIIRAPLVYGAKVKGNLSRLMAVIFKWRIVPLGGIKNKRSMVYVRNLVALIEHVVVNKNSGIILAGDQKLHSTSELVQNIAKGLNSPTKIVALPRLVRLLIRTIKPSLGKRLFNSLVFDNEGTNQRINFRPPYTFEEGIKEMAQDYLLNQDK